MNEKLQELKQLADKENRQVFTDEFREEVDKLLSIHDLEFFTPNYDDYEYYDEDEDKWETDIERFVEEIDEQIHDSILEQEIIYYSRALEYLWDNDPSLQESLWYAYDLWYECKDLSSETLATILYQENLRLEVPWFIEDLKDLLY